MISPVHSNSFVPRMTPSVFNEGAASTASKVVAFVAAAIASIASFIFLPAEAALMLSAGAVTLLSLLCCAPDVQADDQPRRWYQPVVNAFRVFVPQGVHPVIQPGPRVPVGGAVHPHVAPIIVGQPQVGHQEGPRAMVGRRGHELPGAVPVLPHVPAAGGPAVHPVVHHGGPPHQHGAPPHRIPVGHGHEH